MGTPPFDVVESTPLPSLLQQAAHTNMFKTPELRKHHPAAQVEEGTHRRGRSSENFLMFCKMILDYENYEETAREDILRRRHTSSPLGSTGSGAESSMSSGQEDSMLLESPNTGTNTIISDEDSEDDNDVTCYCKKPYGGRPMIECSSCSVWVNLTCAKVKRTAIPDIWYCAFCKTKSTKGGARARARAKARKNAPNGILSRPPPSMKKKS